MSTGVLKKTQMKYWWYVFVGDHHMVSMSPQTAEACSTTEDGDEPLHCPTGYECHIINPGNPAAGIPNRGQCIKQRGNSGTPPTVHWLTAVCLYVTQFVSPVKLYSLKRVVLSRWAGLEAQIL